MKKIPLMTGRDFALVDDADYDWLNQYLWGTTPGGYPIISRNNLLFLADIPTGQSMSRMILGLEPGDSRQADHKNHNILDNQRKNLRICTPSQNRGNSKIMSGFTSKYKGVSWKKQAKKWIAEIQVKGKHIHLGSFENERTAAFAYNLAAKRHFGKFALLNDLNLEKNKNKKAKIG